MNFFQGGGGGKGARAFLSISVLQISFSSSESGPNKETVIAEEQNIKIIKICKDFIDLLISLLFL